MVKRSKSSRSIQTSNTLFLFLKKHILSSQPRQKHYFTVAQFVDSVGDRCRALQRRRVSRVLDVGAVLADGSGPSLEHEHAADAEAERRGKKILFLKAK